MKMTFTAAVAIALAAAVAPAHAQLVTGLYDTGVDANGVALVGDGTSDPHYEIVANDGAQLAGTPAITGNCCYFADNAGSRWITIAGAGTDASVTDYQTTFYVVDAEFPGVVVSGRFAADNHAEIYLNGNDTGFHTDTFGTYTRFNIVSGFFDDVNTLDFRVQNDGGPEALRVAGLSNVALPAVPEPAAWALMLTGFGLVGGAIRARRNAVMT